MLSSTVALIGITLLMALGTWLVFLIALKSGQFKDVEGVKYRMLEDEGEDHKNDKGS